MKGAWGMSQDGYPQGRVTGAMGLPVPEYRPGDCYVWGSCEPASAGASGQSAAWVCNSAVSCAPVLVSDSSHLDVCEVASAGPVLNSETHSNFLGCPKLLRFTAIQLHVRTLHTHACHESLSCQGE